jgi:calcium-dependent protein kinase
MEDSMEENKKKIIFWINGKNEESNFNLFILPETNTLRKLKDELFYEKKLNKSLYDKIKIFNHKGMEIDDIDVSDLTSNQVLYLSLDGQKFNELNYYYEYKIIKEIKTGGYAEVLLGEHVLTKELVSIKKTALENFSTEELYNISREAVYLSTLIHKNIIKMYSSYTYNGNLYNVMAYAEGGELTQLITSKEKLSEERIKFIFHQIHEGVKFIHSKNVIHRDLKPNNILFLDKEKTHVVIIDFGISGIANGRSREIIKAGTIKYIPPEMTSGDHFQSSSKIDIWALGVILYLMNFKIFPFDGNDNDVMEKIAFEPLKFPYGIKIKKSLIKLINGMMEKNANRRIDILDPLFDNWYNDNSNDYQIFKKKTKDDKNRIYKMYSPVKKRSKISDEMLKSPFQIKQMGTKKVGRRFSQKELYEHKDISPIKNTKTKK